MLDEYSLSSISSLSFRRPAGQRLIGGAKWQGEAARAAPIRLHEIKTPAGASFKQSD